MGNRSTTAAEDVFPVYTFVAKSRKFEPQTLILNKKGMRLQRREGSEGSEGSENIAWRDVHPYSGTSLFAHQINDLDSLNPLECITLAAPGSSIHIQFASPRHAEQFVHLVGAWKHKVAIDRVKA